MATPDRGERSRSDGPLEHPTKTRSPYLVMGISTVSYLFSTKLGTSLVESPPLNPLGTSTPKLATSIAFFAVLISFLIISFIARELSTKRHRILWFSLVAATAVGSVVFANGYLTFRERIAFQYPRNNEEAPVYYGGISPTENAQVFWNRHPNLSNAEVIDEFGGFDMITYVWPTQSIQEAGKMLTRRYVAMLLCICSCVFCLIQGLLPGRPIT
jgi:hypothetical protein